MQEDFVQLMQALAPDLMQEMAMRALAMERIAAMAPVGRRQLAARLMLPEREVRSAANALREGGFIALDASGMTLTPRGMELLPRVQAFTRELHGLTEMETRLAEGLNVSRVCVVSGSAEGDESVLNEVGRAAAQRVRSLLHSGSTMAVSGGSTMAAVARAMQTASPMRVMVVPARGGLGRADVATQANAIAAEIAGRLGGSHRLIHMPDHMDEAARQELLRLPDVREVMELIQRADVILHGVGSAEENIRETKLSASQARRLLQEGAVGEAFGSYFDREGNCLLESSSVGVDLARLSPSSRMIAVACGKTKAEAIIAVMRHDKHELLVTDEAAAREILRLLKG